MSVTLSPDLQAEERKRLGQYFSGRRLALLLAHLARAGAAKSVVDPMAGVGDMLAASLELGGGTERVYGVEIDPGAVEQSRQQLRTASGSILVSEGDAFSRSSWPDLRQWSLVITNPPYVRYQRGAGGSLAGLTLPSPSDVRCGLLSLVEANEELSVEERRVFAALAAGYGGLADLAVPSWLLSASLVREGGTLAMVVPDTWLSRDYAASVLYALCRFFKVELVVEDADAVWFPDALVRTTLLVARRVADRGTAFAASGTGYLRARLNSSTVGPGSVVERIFPDRPDPDLAFTERLYELLEARSEFQSGQWSAKWHDDRTLSDLLRQRQGPTWVGVCEGPGPRVESGSPARARICLPGDLRTALEVPDTELQGIDSFGWTAGQGLRTGGNRFFYLDLVAAGTSESRLSPGGLKGLPELSVPNVLLAPVVQRQRDCDAGFVQTAEVRSRVLLLRGWALAEDIAFTREAGVACHDRPLPEALAEHIRRSAHLNVGSAEEPRRLPELSAVRTNVKAPDSARPDRSPSHWYQLPALAPRHTPNLFLARVNHLHPRALRSATPGLIVDANFTTFWPTSAGAVSEHVILALMNSSWVRAQLELSATVLGGGALKVEAAHVRRLAFPSPSPSALESLETCGRALGEPRQSEAALTMIDRTLIEALPGPGADERQNVLARLSADRLITRSSRLSLRHAGER
ncbi:MAG: hypothetical protein JWN46_1984 [Acidimicrobiales bacterium]|nr:hypothetical protein [Acidimicrobiales bacterium]